VVARRLGMGLVGPGFVGAHHIDAVRRLGFVDVVAVCASTLEKARAKAAALGVARAYDDVDAMAADPSVDVVHIATPNADHGRAVRAALAAHKHVVCEKPLATSSDEAHALWTLAREAARASGVVHAVMFNYRGNPMVQQARALVAAGDIGAVHFVHGAYLQDWLLEPSDFSWRLEPERGGPSVAFGDIGSHWVDLVQHVTGRRIEAVLAELTTVVPVRRKPETSREAFAPTGAADAEPFHVRGDDLASVLLWFEGGAKGCVSVGQVCAGHKNDCWFEVNGASGSLRWNQERQNDLWIGRRHEANARLQKDPALLSPHAARYAHLPGGHQEGWSDAFTNICRDVYLTIADAERVDRDAHLDTHADAQQTAMATFEDGYRAACLVEAVLDSHRRGGVWTTVRSES
jgi:predicted dehydrogenase